jgi:hypothetical protein
MYKGEFLASTKIYESISNKTIDDIILKDIIQYIDKIYLKNKGRKQLIYIKGFLFFKMKKNYPQALEIFNEFLDIIKGTGSRRYTLLSNLTKRYIKTIEKEMKLLNNGK